MTRDPLLQVCPSNHLARQLINRAITIVDKCKRQPLGSQIVCYILFNDVIPISDVIDFSLVYTIKYFDFESFVLMYLIALTEEVPVY